MPLTPAMQAVLEFLAENPGVWTYGQIGQALNIHPRAVGAIMRGLGHRGYAAECNRVVRAERPTTSRNQR